MNTLGAQRLGTASVLPRSLLGSWLRIGVLQVGLAVQIIIRALRELQVIAS